MKYMLYGIVMSSAIAQAAVAQTSYPMLMSLKPTAAQVGQTSEHEVKSRYSMFGATEILVTGEGVTGEIVSEMKELKPGEAPPNLTTLKVKFTVAADAVPGVRDFRIATPQGASTLGQLVVVRDPVVYEDGKNDAADGAQEISLPATVCGAIERNEDLDFFKFTAEAGAKFTFHVRSMRLQDRMHDLQQHSDPIISLRTEAGTTIAQSDNYFAGDPLLFHEFAETGTYLLEVRDVRYTGNQYWEYSIEINDRPFVIGMHPSAVRPGLKEHAVELIGFNLPNPPAATFDVPENLPFGLQTVLVPLGDQPSELIPVFVTDLPMVVESDGENNLPNQAQAISVPSTVSGRIESEADLDCYVFEAKKGEQISVEVFARRQQSSLDSVVRILNTDGRQLVENDDSTRFRATSPDAWIETWTVPADGQYVLEIRDLHLRGGDHFPYAMRVTRADPYFDLYLDSDKTQLTPGTHGVIFVRAERKNGFNGDIQLQVDGLPPGVTASCGRIPAKSGKYADGCIILQTTAETPLNVGNITVTGISTFTPAEGEPIELAAVAVPQQETYMPGGGRSHWQVDMHSVSVAAPSDILKLTLSTNEVVLKPGESQRIGITIERAEGFDKNVTLDMLYRHLNSVFADTLPPGVTIDTKNSNTLLTGKQSEGHITLVAEANAEPMERRQVAVMANVSLNFVMKATYSSEPLFVTVAAGE